MNEDYFKYAIELLDSMSTEELEESLRTHGINVTRKVPMKYEGQELRLYSFVNHYLASGGPHAGIQTGHAAVDLTRKYTNAFADVSPNDVEMIVEWADNHKTFIVLNGGMHVEMLRVKKLVEESGFPFSVFHESEEALNGIMTTVAVVLPEQIFNMQRGQDLNLNKMYSYTREVNGTRTGYTSMVGDHNFEFIDMLKSKRLAS